MLLFFSFFFLTFSGYSFQASRFAQRLSTAIRGTEELRYWNYVVGTALLELRYWNFVIGTTLFELRYWNYVIGTS